jgi:hypothetical protein
MLCDFLIEIHFTPDEDICTETAQHLHDLHSYFLEYSPPARWQYLGAKSVNSIPASQLTSTRL